MSAKIPRHQRAFWEKMATKYPLPFEEKSLADTIRLIEMVEACGVRIDGASILDIGCGTGRQSLLLAQRAVKVLGLDFSQGMVDCFERERQKHGIANAAVMRCAWNELDITAQGLEKGFDIAWASMTPAMRGTDDLTRMNRCAREWCVYIGWGRTRRNPFLEEVFAAHALTFGPPPGAIAAQGLLRQLGIDTEVSWLESSWNWQGTEQEAVDHAAAFVESQGDVTPDSGIIREITAKFSRNGQVSCCTEAEKGVLTWRAR